MGGGAIFAAVAGAFPARLSHAPGRPIAVEPREETVMQRFQDVPAARPDAHLPMRRMTGAATPSIKPPPRGPTIVLPDRSAEHAAEPEDGDARCFEKSVT